MTFSIVARSSDASLFGVAIASSSPAVAARCAHARARCGAVASQNLTDPTLGPFILGELAGGASAEAAMDAALKSTPFGAYRQILVISREGAPAAHGGGHALGMHAEVIGEHCAAGGNLLAHADVPAVMVAAFAAAQGNFGTRLLRALYAGLERGGEAGPVHSAGLLIVRDVSWPIVDLRVDWQLHDPLTALGAAWDIYAPQIDQYVQRALDPSSAPTFGVAGDA